MGKYDYKKIEKKWQDKWEKQGIFHAEDFSKKKKYYSLVEFPYPSGEGLHVGHPRPYIALDIVSRKRRMEGYNVLYPFGWDAFGLPAENYAIKTGAHPSEVVKNNVKRFKSQIQSLGISFDWSREINTTDPAYYKWTQWIFLKFFEHGLAYKKKMPINWCISCKIGLANEEVVNGKCERCGGEIEKREKEQWMLKITQYADKLIKDLDLVDYWERIKAQQINWIGKSEGAELEFKVKGKYNFVLLHGYNGTSKGIFFPWLKKSLEEKGYKVVVPDLPNSDFPTEQEQVEHVIKNVKFDENTILLGHSLGAVVAMKVVEKLGHKIAGLALASGFSDPNFKDLKRPFEKTFIWKFDFKKIKENVGFVKVLSDKSDYAVSLEQGRFLHSNLGGELVETIGKGEHFCSTEEPEILSSLNPNIKVFTTRPDTLFGATYMVLAPEHSLINQLKDKTSNWKEVEKYIKDAIKKTHLERTAEEKEKTGIELKGIKAINPANKKDVPVWVADYVLAEYGTGAIMAVPAHDERDYAFAKKYKLPIVDVIEGGDIKKEAYVGEGKLINSGKFNDVDFEKAKKQITKEVGGKTTTIYKLRDWVFSRQRYWGEPIPLVYCEKCGWVPVEEKDLPVELPDVEKYQPTDTGESPLASIKDWVNTDCSKCGGPAKRETDTMPNWAGSSWYFLRYTDSENEKAFADKKNLKYWGSVDWYNGGMEHTTLHLLYSRFWYKFLYDIGEIPKECGPEPYKKRTSHGMILGEGGEKMSKSRGNVVNPDEIVEKYGADAMRLYEMFMGPFDQAIPWNTEAMEGTSRFLERVFGLQKKVKDIEPSENINKLAHKAIKKITQDIEELKFNTAIAILMGFVNELMKLDEVPSDSYKILITLLHPFAPHITEELNKAETLLAQSEWPSWDEEETIDKEISLVIQVNGKVRDTIVVSSGIKESEAKEIAHKSEKVQKWISGQKIKKVIFIKDKLLNIVV